MEIRFGSADDLNILAAAEAQCFNRAERADTETIRERLNAYPNHFLLLHEGGELAAYIDGAATKERDLSDAMFEDVSMHDENGGWQMIFGLGVLPKFRGRGYAAALINSFAELAESERRLGVVLTCKPRLVPFYTKFGFIDEGVCPSIHGGAVWHQMRMEFKKR